MVRAVLAERPVVLGRAVAEVVAEAVAKCHRGQTVKAVQGVGRVLSLKSSITRRTVPARSSTSILPAMYGSIRRPRFSLNLPWDKPADRIQAVSVPRNSLVVMVAKRSGRDSQVPAVAAGLADCT